MSEVYVLDFDYTLADTGDMVYELYAAAEEVDPALREKLVDYNNKRMLDGADRAMFQPEMALGDKTAEVLEAFSQLIGKNVKKYIPEDAERLLKNIAGLGKTAIILTFCGDEAWQRVKIDAVLQALGYNLPVIYTTEKVKSRVLKAAWSEKDQVYRFEIETDDGIVEVVAESLVGIGDELTDFEGYEQLKNARGYYKNADQPAPDALPDGIVHIRSLDETRLAA
jgi:hypothetical protein